MTITGASVTVTAVDDVTSTVETVYLDHDWVLSPIEPIDVPQKPWATKGELLKKTKKKVAKKPKMEYNEEEWI